MELGDGDGQDDVTRFVAEALVTAETEPAPGPLRSRVLEAAMAQRPAGRPRHSVELSPVEGYRRTVDELATLLAGLAHQQWAATVEHYGWTVQGLVGHVLAVEQLLAARLGLDDVEAPDDDADHIAMSLGVVEAQADRSPADTLADWRATSGRAVEALSTSPPDLADRVAIHGLDLTWGSLLVIRSLELWTHTDDIRRAVGLPLQAPDAERLTSMTDLAVRTLPLRLATTGTYRGTARIVLTGPGGGAWSQGLSLGESEAAGDPDVRLVADAVAFCRLSAGRIDADELGATITGDQHLAAAILATAAAFAV
jgi:uncharacterized protein (TIGR03083 family)